MTTTKSDKGLMILPEQAVDLSSPQQLVEFAKTLKQFIIQQKLFVQINGKNYVEVEGWQFAGAATGVTPVVKLVERVEVDTEIKYRAEVELRRITNDQVVGYGVAICSNREIKKTKFDEYAVASMAQTRATGKAYRNAFAWLMKIAGYEPTPAEEADANNMGMVEPNTQERIAKAENAQALSGIMAELSAEEQKAAAPLFQKRLRELKHE